MHTTQKIGGSIQFRCYSPAGRHMNNRQAFELIGILTPRARSDAISPCCQGKSGVSRAVGNGAKELMKPRLHLFAQQPQGGHHLLVRDQTTAIYLRQDTVDADLFL